MLKIEKKITGVAVAKTDDPVPEAPAAPALTLVPPAQVLPDVNPLYVRVENRPDEALDAVIEKVTYNTQHGKKKVYVAVSFLEVDGVLGGKPVVIERPIEIFLPAGQTEEDGQWIVATMRSLSLAARGGYLTRALQDLRQVPWTKGPVRCGEKDWGNGKVVPVQHPSEVAAIAYAIQRILYNRGFLDVDGNQVPVEVLARRHAKQASETRSDPELELVAANPSVQADEAAATPAAPSGKTCPQCGGSNVRPMDGCDTCMDCGHSKCA